MDTFFIVADKFAEFTVNKNTITLRQLFALFELPAHLLPEEAQLKLGQGVSDADCDRIIERVGASETLSARWKIDDLRNRTERAPATLSHKHKHRNTLICPPDQIDANTFRVDLRIDQDCELMDDHQTGQHVQGMILIEAARQAFLAVTEKYFLAGSNQKSYFVINTMNTEFRGFVFPLDAFMEYRIVSKDINERRQRFEVQIDLIQGGEIRARTNTAFTAYPHEIISGKEAMLAGEALAFAQSQMQDLRPSA